MVNKAPPSNAFVAQYRDLTSGLNWKNLGATALVLAGGIGIAAWGLLSLGGEDEGRHRRVPPAAQLPPEQKLKYSDLAGPVQQAVANLPNHPPSAGERKADPVHNEKTDEKPTGPKVDEDMQKARNSEIVQVAVKFGNMEDSRTRSEAAGGKSKVNSFSDGGHECRVNAGTGIPVTVDTAVSTAQNSTVRARVVQDVYDTATGSCLAIPNGSTFVGDVKRSDIKGQRRAELLFFSLTRPYPRGDTVELKVPGSDAMGRGGVPGDVDSHMGSQGLLVLASTAVDLGVAALSGGFGILGSILGGNAQRPLDRWAHDQLDRPPEINVDPLQGQGRMTVILREPIDADDVRD